MGRLSILVVDDNIVSLASIEQELKDKYEVITCNSGMRAMRYLKQGERPDLILLDVQMTVMDGIETLSEIRNMEDGLKIPVIMITSSRDKKTIIDSSKLGAIDYVLKPYDVKELHQRIERTLKKTGTIPVEESEIYNDIKDVWNELEENNLKNATVKINEIMNYQIDEEIFGRLQAARSKLMIEEGESARRLVGRLVKLFERRLSLDASSKRPYNAGAVRKGLRDVLSALQNFEVKEASQRLDNVLAYDLPPEIGEDCGVAQEYLHSYDDGAAEEIIVEVMKKLGN